MHWEKYKGSSVTEEMLKFGKFCYLGSKIFSVPHQFFSLRIKLGRMPSAISFPESKDMGGAGSKILI